MTSTPKEIADAMVTALEDLKADNIQVLDVRTLTSMCDYMIIGSGRSNRQVRAIADRAIEEAQKRGIRPLGTEGYEAGEWVLVDLGDVVVHCMHPLTRAFYQLEKLWGDPELARQSTAV
ncbi:MAG: ribosome silencing factor [Gammaproteobacteria bacterium]|nr:ribosome silencing factor [Gammaproteobacteria bacterium]MCG3144497.1 Ribosomal silencing factor RsfS [Gammaproteobacteria bacterium]